MMFKVFLLLLLTVIHSIHARAIKDSPITPRIFDSSISEYTCFPWIFNPGCPLSKYVPWNQVCKTNTLGWEQCSQKSYNNSKLNLKTTTQKAISRFENPFSGVVNEIQAEEKHDQIKPNNNMDIEVSGPQKLVTHNHYINQVSEQLVSLPTFVKVDAHSSKDSKPIDNVTTTMPPIEEVTTTTATEITVLVGSMQSSTNDSSLYNTTTTMSLHIQSTTIVPSDDAEGVDISVSETDVQTTTESLSDSSTITNSQSYSVTTTNPHTNVDETTQLTTTHQPAEQESDTSTNNPYIQETTFSVTTETFELNSSVSSLSVEDDEGESEQTYSPKPELDTTTSISLFGGEDLMSESLTEETVTGSSMTTLSSNTEESSQPVTNFENDISSTTTTISNNDETTSLLTIESTMSFSTDQTLSSLDSDTTPSSTTTISSEFSTTVDSVSTTSPSETENSSQLIIDLQDDYVITTQHTQGIQTTPSTEYTTSSDTTESLESSESYITSSSETELTTTVTLSSTADNNLYNSSEATTHELNLTEHSTATSALSVVEEDTTEESLTGDSIISELKDTSQPLFTTNTLPFTSEKVEIIGTTKNVSDPDISTSTNESHSVLITIDETNQETSTFGSNPSNIRS